MSKIKSNFIRIQVKLSKFVNDFETFPKTTILEINNMNLLIVKPTNDFEAFIEFWAQFYDYKSPFELNYDKHIKFGKPFTHKDILELFEFVYHTGLGRIRTESIKEKIYPHLDYINDMKFEETIDLDEFQAKFNKSAPVTQTFLLHIIQPTKYPLYDQNIQNAYNYSKGRDLDTPFPRRPEAHMKFYFKKLQPFIESNRGNLSLKRIDEGLNTFGQLVKRNPKFKYEF